MAKKPMSSQGRKKLAMVKIPKKNNLQVTFSKRRSGLFKKASDLCTLCGVQIAIVVFSPAEKPFSFGHPEVEPIVDRFLSQRSSSSPMINSAGSNHYQQRAALAHQLNVELAQLLNQLETERNRGGVLEEMRSAGRSQWWWEKPIEEMGLEEAELLKTSMEELKKDLNTQAYHLMNIGHHHNSQSLAMTTNNNYESNNNGVQYWTVADHIFERKQTEVFNSGSVEIFPNVCSFGHGHAQLFVNLDQWGS